MQQKLLFLAVIFVISILKIQGCTETAVCSHGFIPKKNCGKWSCYRDYANIPRQWRGYWGVTHVCEWTWPGSHAVSIHCAEENNWTKARFLYFFTGLYIPKGLPWAPWLFRWTDGTPVNFADWARPGQGSAFQQPHNDVPIERVVDFTNHWHDTISNNPVTNRILCKRNPTKIIRVCPTTKAAPPTPKLTTLTTTKHITPSDIVLETLPYNDVPVIIPKTEKPPPKSSPKSCKV
uniref:C-type lectin domain-containing protein n=1 Tax=Panagrolaimus sp. ES5 TaxID=591445 RepID=A0AC34FPM8_9BILA